MKKIKYNNSIVKVIVVIILILYILFLYMDFYNAKIFNNTKYIKYLCVLLCFLLSIVSKRKPIIDTGNYTDIFLLRLALFITVFADLCLVIFEVNILGVVLFCLVQITYSVRYTTVKIKTTLISFFIIFQCIVLTYLIACLFIREINILLPISIFYFICLFTSVSKAIKACKNNLYPFPNKFMIALGMILFLLCDLCVFLSYINIKLPLTGNFIRSVQQIASLLVWVFYLPSQLLLSLSGINRVNPMDIVDKTREL